LYDQNEISELEDIFSKSQIKSYYDKRNVIS